MEAKLIEAFHKTHTATQAWREKLRGLSREKKLQLWKVELLRQLHVLDQSPYYCLEAFGSAAEYNKWLKNETTLVDGRLLDVTDKLQAFLDGGNAEAVTSRGLMSGKRTFMEWICPCCVGGSSDEDGGARRSIAENDALVRDVLQDEATSLIYSPNPGMSFAFVDAYICGTFAKCL